MTTEAAVEKWQPQQVAPGGAPMTTPEEWSMIRDQAAWIARSQMYPALKSPEGVVVAMLSIRDMGISMTLGLQEAFEIKGKIGFGTKAKLASLMGRVPGFQWETTEWDEKVCKLRARLDKSMDWKPFTYTRADADRAGYSKDRNGGVKDIWAAKPALMLLYRALTRWMNLHAIHVLMGLPPVLVDDDEPREIPHEVVETKPASGEAQAKATDGAAAPEVERDYRKEFAALARKMGKTTNAQFLELVSLLFTQDLGLTAPKSYSAIGPSDWKTAYGAAMKRWDEEGRPRLAEVPAQKAGPAQAVTLEVATSKSEAVVVEEFEEASFPETAPESIIARSPDPGPSDEIVRLQHGDPKALVDVGMQAEALFKTHNKRRRFIQEHPEGSGDVYFTDSPILLDCGSTREVDGKVVATPALLESTEHGLLVATEGLRIMLGRALKMAMDELEAPR